MNILNILKETIAKFKEEKELQEKWKLFYEHFNLIYSYLSMHKDIDLDRISIKESTYHALYIIFDTNLGEREIFVHKYSNGYWGYYNEIDNKKPLFYFNFKPNRCQIQYCEIGGEAAFLALEEFMTYVNSKRNETFSKQGFQTVKDCISSKLFLSQFLGNKSNTKNSKVYAVTDTYCLKNRVSFHAVDYPIIATEVIAICDDEHKAENIRDRKRKEVENNKENEKKSIIYHYFSISEVDRC